MPNNRRITTITVGELKDILEDFDRETPIFFAYNYGDYWKTKVAHDIEDVQEGIVEFSDYHSMYKVNTEDEEPDGKITHKAILIK